MSYAVSAAAGVIAYSWSTAKISCTVSAASRMITLIASPRTLERGAPSALTQIFSVQIDGRQIPRPLALPRRPSQDWHILGITIPDIPCPREERPPFILLWYQNPGSSRSSVVSGNFDSEFCCQSTSYAVEVVSTEDDTSYSLLAGFSTFRVVPTRHSEPFRVGTGMRHAVITGAIVHPANIPAFSRSPSPLRKSIRLPPFHRSWQLCSNPWHGLTVATGNVVWTMDSEAQHAIGSPFSSLGLGVLSSLDVLSESTESWFVSKSRATSKADLIKFLPQAATAVPL
ncbi:hypothetical protein GGX14DRAFT_604882 [Mycena pura]|uniref:Uncharacterized protein n=1 Tax=Mycena pura TaxID=153505 RepID=A0AAD6VLD7_9AGAR|nr:hypothetical protein GGX14DRAFT_604882 [Mycena pura]